MYLPSPEARYTILYSRPNGGDLGKDLSFVLYTIHRCGFNVLVYDYRGYGTSGGSPTETNAYRDIDAVYNYLVNVRHTVPQRIIVMGRSLGGGPSVDLAARVPTAGLILESTFTSAYRIIWLGYILPTDCFRNIDKIASVRCPVLVMHGRADAVVPFSHALKLFAAANEPKRCAWFDAAGHENTLRTNYEPYCKALRDFAALLDTIQ